MGAEPAWPWSLLGLAPTGDAAAIRRAYARRLKAIQPEDDPDMFQRLREARTAALDAAAEAPLEEGEAQVGHRGNAQQMSAVGDVTFDDDPLASPPRTVVVVASDMAETTLLEKVEPETNVASPPRPVIVEIAPLDATSEGDKADDMTAALRDCLAPLAGRQGAVDRTAYDAVLRQAAMLPLAPRREVEEQCLRLLTQNWRTAKGTFDRRVVGRVLPLLQAADDLFGWGRDDWVVSATLEPRDVDALALMLDAAAYRARYPKLPIPLRLRPADARAYLTYSPTQLEVYEETVARKRMPWRLRGWAFFAPHLWAFRRGLWIEAGLFYVIASIPAFCLSGRQVGRFSPLAAAGALLLFAAILTVSGFLADRIVFRAADRAVRRADARCLFDRARREAYLVRKGSPLGIWALCIVGFALILMLYPYTVLLLALDAR